MWARTNKTRNEKGKGKKRRRRKWVGRVFHSSTLFPFARGIVSSEGKKKKGGGGREKGGKDDEIFLYSLYLTYLGCGEGGVRAYSTKGKQGERKKKREKGLFAFSQRVREERKKR